jgi:hypothetical protein
MRRALLAILLIAIVAGCGGSDDYAGVSPESAKAQADAKIKQLNPGGTSLVFDHQARGRDPLTRRAWEVYFERSPSPGSRSGRCIVYISRENVSASRDCGLGVGGKKKTPKMTRDEYVAALNKLCSSANQRVAALKLTTSMGTWKRHGQKAASIATETVTLFKALTPPDELKKTAEEYNAATDETVRAVQNAVDAAKAGDVKKFDAAISQQANSISKSNAAAAEIGASECFPG